MDAHGGVVRVGVIDDPPFVVSDGDGVHGGDPSGPEIDFVRAYARSINARPVWLHSGAERLLEDLEHYQADMVVGGLTKDSPWKKRVSLTLPVPVRNGHGHLQQRVLALPPGENRWQVQIERFQRSAEGRAILEAPLAEPSGPIASGATQ